MLTLRSAVPGDETIIHQLVRELADYERLLHEVRATAEDFARDLFGSHPRVFCDLAEWEGEPVGFALWFNTYSTFRGRHGLYLEDLYVRPAHRGRGIGKALMAQLARRCGEDGLARLEWAVLDWNAPSIGFYRSLGAQPQDEWTVYRLAGEALERAGDQAEGR
jgi:GNAT superfamily N-acetyltransferase